MRSRLNSTLSNALLRAAPVIFVFLWATGFIGAKYGTNDAEPFTFLAIRFAITFVILLIFVRFYVRPQSLDWRQIIHSMLIGCLIQGIYLGGVFYAIDRGMAAGISSIVVALQPFFTAIVAFFLLGESLSVRKIMFLFLALTGVVLVLSPKLDFEQVIPGITAETFAAALIGTIAISIGAVYQKRSVTTLNLWVSTTAQFAGAAMFLAVFAFLFETREIIWSGELVFSLVWLIFVLSIGAVALLMFLIRQGDTSSVASLFFLVPVVAMGMSWLLFDEQLVMAQIIGSCLVIVSVALASRQAQKSPHR